MLQPEASIFPDYHSVSILYIPNVAQMFPIDLFSSQVINVTLPDEKSNYVHRIGRVGRAERMGLAISLVATVPEKVWYHGQWCASRGKNCWNTRLVEEKGCCMWYNEKQYLADIEDHLNITIQQIDVDIKVPLNDFDGKVTTFLIRYIDLYRK